MQDDTDFTADHAQLHAMMLARQQIELLRRWYAAATDQLGLVDDKDAQASGLAIYHRIFASDANIRVTRDGEALLHARGPDGWADVARDALRDYASTQHLIGTQLVTFENVQFGPETGAITDGTAHMSSHLQATHVWPDPRIRLVLGTYLDQVRLQPGIGWQIHDMILDYTHEEFRQLSKSE